MNLYQQVQWTQIGINYQNNFQVYMRLDILTNNSTILS